MGLDRSEGGVGWVKNLARGLEDLVGSAGHGGIHLAFIDWEHTGDPIL